MASTSPIDLTIFGKNVRFLRDRYGWTQQEMAEAMGMTSFATVSKWESGKAVPRSSAVTKLCERFSVTKDDLFMVDLETGASAEREHGDPSMLRVYAGLPSADLDDAYLRTPELLPAGRKSEDYIGYIISDKKMHPYYMQDDTAVIRLADRVTSECDALICYADEHAAVVRRVVPDQFGGMIIQCLNPSFSSRHVIAEEVQVLGIVTELRRRF